MAQKPTKIADVTHAADVSPATTSRPVLVTNRPILSADPMMAPAAGAGAMSTAPVVPMTRTARTIAPLDAARMVVTAGDGSTPTNSVLITPDMSPQAHSEGVDMSVKSAAGPAASTTGATSGDTELAQATSETVVEVATPTRTGTGPIDAAETTGMSMPRQVNDLTKGTEPTFVANIATSSSTNGQKTVEVPEPPEEAMPELVRDPEAAALAAVTEAADAKSARQVELEALISSGKYRVPINASHRKRSRRRVVLWCLLALMLAVALIDVILDVGMIALPVDIPSTHFFTND